MSLLKMARWAAAALLALASCYSGGPPLAAGSLPSAIGANGSPERVHDATGLFTDTARRLAAAARPWLARHEGPQRGLHAGRARPADRRDPSARHQFTDVSPAMYAVGPNGSIKHDTCGALQCARTVMHIAWH